MSGRIMRMEQVKARLAVSKTAAIARQTGIDVGVLNNIASGRTKNPGIVTITTLSDFFDNLGVDCGAKNHGEA